ncbi:WXG100 family type VII secretion target [Streptomyces sp. NPDC088725]|uniref:WXG100 family type VII secretion target n=1 Tax=Streptomyces sp. NPDC088725 TaxID=3365873 RepID=UPI00382D64EF
MAVQKVNGHSLAKLQDELGRNFDSVKAQLRSLQGTIDGLEGHWKGIGAGAFNKKQTEINDHMVNIGNLLVKYQDAIQAARTISGNTEDEIEAAMKGIDVSSGGDSGASAATSNLSSY